jgi:protein PhnA
MVRLRLEEFMATEPQCPKCKSEYTYADGNLWVCPECSHEWSLQESTATEAAEVVVADDTVRDSNGNILNDGDHVTVLKDLRVKGSSSVVKGGTKVRNIRIISANDAVDGHNIACKIDGIGAMNLKSEFVRKV